jgi:hypothetical protein
MIPMLLQMFGPVLAGLLKNLGERAIAGWKASAIKASVSVAAVEGLAVSMGCDVGSLEAGLMAVPAALLAIFEVPANMAMPTILDAMRTAVEQKRTSDAVLADAKKQQEDAAKKFGIPSVALLLLSALAMGCSAAQVQKTQAVIVKLKADAQHVAVIGCQNLPLLDVTMDVALTLLPPGTTIDQINRGWTVAEPEIRAFCERLEQRILQPVQ